MAKINYRKFYIQFETLKAAAKLSAFGTARDWVNYGPAEIYLRIGPKFLDGKRVQCLQIANISTPPEHQRKGNFIRFLEAVQRLTELPLYVENVINKEFCQSLVSKYGFEEVENHGGIPCLMYVGREGSREEAGAPQIAA